MKKIFQIIIVLSILFTGVSSCSKDDDDVPVSRIDFNKTTMSIAIGSTERLYATIYPEGATDKRIRWFSDNPEIAAVDENGTVKGESVGVTVIRLTDASNKIYLYPDASCAVSVHEPTVSVTGLSIGKASTTISVNGVEELNYTVVPANASNKNVTWNSNDISVVTVDGNGKITGIAAGKATVTVSSEDGQFTSSCAVTVQEQTVPATGITLDKATLTVIVNSTGELSATVAPSNATNKNVTWSSNATTVATVVNGVVTGVSAGSATITATTENGDFASSCIVTVKEADVTVTGVTLNKTTLDIYSDDVEELTAEVSPANATNKTVSWSSSATSVATVSDNGVVTGISAGTATITATAANGGFSSTCTVTVKNEMGNVTSTSWSAPSANSYEYSMTYVAQVAFRGVLSTDTDVEVAAYVGTELRGYAKIVHEPQLNKYLVHLTIYSNSAGNETVTLKAYNPQKQRIYQNEGFMFQGNASLGSASEILNFVP